MKFSQLIKYSVRNIFNVENEVGRLVSDLFFFKKALYKVKAASGQDFSFNISW